MQVSARIRIAADPRMQQILTDTGEGHLLSTGTLVEMDLQPRTRYYWTVQVYTDAQEEATGPVCFFETGKGEETWAGQWITPPDIGDTCPVFERDFLVDMMEAGKKRDSLIYALVKGHREEARKLVAGRLYCMSPGLLYAGLNGSPVTDEVEVSGCADPRDRITIRTWDVTALLQASNHLELMTAPARPVPSGEKQQPAICAELRVTYSDGSEEVIATNGDWDVTWSDLQSRGNWEREALTGLHTEKPAQKARTLPADHELLQNRILTDRMCPPVRVYEEVAPIKTTEEEDGSLMLDLGRVICGSFRLHTEEKAGQQIRMTFTEKPGEPGSSYVITTDGRNFDHRPCFAIYRYRYVRLEGAGNLGEEDFRGLVYTSDSRQTGTLVTGNDDLNRLLAADFRSRRNNRLTFPMAYPYRREPRAWLGEAVLGLDGELYACDVIALYCNLLYELRLTQAKAGGSVPLALPAMGEEETACLYGDAAVLIPWKLYLAGGDLQIIRESFESMRAWVDYVTAVDGEDHGWRRLHHIGDRLALDLPGRNEISEEGATDPAYIADACYLKSVRILSRCASLLAADLFDQQEESFARMTDYLELSDRYRRLADRILQEIRREYFTETGRCAVTTQTGYLLALELDLAPDRERVLQALLCDLRLRGLQAVTGQVGGHLLCRVLSQAGYEKMAYDLLYKDPRLAAMSTAWIWENVAGFQLLEDYAGGKRLLLRPLPDGRTRWARASWLSAAGCWKMHWEIMDETHVYVKVTVPFDCTARLLLPYAAEEEAVQELEAGDFDMIYEVSRPYDLGEEEEG